MRPFTGAVFRAEQQFARLKAQFGEAYCALLPINTEANVSDDKSPAPDPWAQYVMATPSCPQVLLTSNVMNALC
jgi:hypothetical protein